MSERLERVREAFAALNRGDYEAAADYVTEDGELRQPAWARL